MPINHSLELIIGDLRTLEKAVDLSDSEQIQETIVLYLMANSDFIERGIDEVYSSMTREQRAELCDTHLGLHQSVISDDFRRVALSAIERAKTQWSPIADNISRDELHMLRRALQYAQYIVHPGVIARKIYLHPIDSHIKM